MDILIAVTMTFLVRSFALPISQNVDWPSTGHISQLRLGRGNENRCSRYVLPRIVRLTIETNTITGTLPSSHSQLFAFRLIPFSAAVAIVSFALYVGFPVSVFKSAHHHPRYD